MEHICCECLGLATVKEIISTGAMVLWITHVRKDFKRSQVQPFKPYVEL